MHHPQRIAHAARRHPAVPSTSPQNPLAERLATPLAGARPDDVESIAAHVSALIAMDPVARAAFLALASPLTVRRE